MRPEAALAVRRRRAMWLAELLLLEELQPARASAELEERVAAQSPQKLVLVEEQ